MQPNIPTDVIAGLLPEFRRCETYADRLAFWGKHQLTEQLYYDAVTVERERHPADFLNACIKCRTWQEAKHLPVLTLAPFSADEALQFVEWALQVRPGMSDAPNTSGTEINEFQRKYTEEPFDHRRTEMLTKYRESSHLWLKGRLHKSSAASKNTLDLIGVDSNRFDEVMNELLQRKPLLDLMQRISIGQVDFDWTAVDTCLFAKAKYDFAVFLEKFDPANQQLQPIADESSPKLIESTPTPSQAYSNKTRVILNASMRAREELYTALSAYIEIGQHKDLENLLLRDIAPEKHILWRPLRVELGVIIGGQSGITNKTNTARWVCSHFRFIDNGKEYEPSFETFRNYLSDKGVSPKRKSQR